jgi:hypothetical protein
MISGASGPNMEAPRTLSVSASTTSFITVFSCRLETKIRTCILNWKAHRCFKHQKPGDAWDTDPASPNYSKTRQVLKYYPTDQREHSIPYIPKASMILSCPSSLFINITQS